AALVAAPSRRWFFGRVPPPVPADALMGQNTITSVSADGGAALFTVLPPNRSSFDSRKPPAPSDTRARVLLWSAPVGRLTELLSIEVGGGQFGLPFAVPQFSPDGRYVRG